jgi:hypothetical protein
MLFLFDLCCGEDEEDFKYDCFVKVRTYNRRNESMHSNRSQVPRPASSLTALTHVRCCLLSFLYICRRKITISKKKEAPRRNQQPKAVRTSNTTTHPRQYTTPLGNQQETTLEATIGWWLVRSHRHSHTHVPSRDESLDDDDDEVQVSTYYLYYKATYYK